MVAAGAVVVRAATAIRTEILYHNRQGMVNETAAAGAKREQQEQERQQQRWAMVLRQHDGGGDGCC